MIRRIRPRLQFRPHVQMLEDRALPSVMISVGDAIAIEGSTQMKFFDPFVAPQSGGLTGARGIDYGPDGNLYVSAESEITPGSWVGFVNRYDASTGRFIDVFSSDPGLDGAKDVEFGPDGNLYVPNNVGDNVYRFNGTSGAFMDIFVSTGSGGLDTPRSLIFGPDGNGDGQQDLYITSAATDNVLRFDGVTGAFIDAFVSSGSGGLNDPTALVFGPDGNLYVASGAHSDFYNSILRYDGATGAFMDVFVPAGSAGLTLAPTAGVIFGPDVNGDGTADMYVSNGEVDEVLIYNGMNGSFLQKYLTPGLGGLDDPKGLRFDNDGNLLVVNNGDNSVRRFGPSSLSVFTVSLSEPSSETVSVDYSTANSSALAGSDYTALSGTLTFAPGETTRTILVRTLDDTTGEPTESFTLTLSNPVGATIADGTGVGTILDNETKFFVVDDATANQTFEYASGGVSVEAYALNSGNTAPRGAASTAAGDKVWVVDANKKVYVYNTGGGLLGSWTAGSLNAQAQVEGIATNGTDIWIVDAKQDKVFRYTGAASRLSGSQNAASSFSLNASNTNPKDIVTDGTSLWVVNDSTTDKVFKYTLAGSLLGSWTIDSANASPTGITLDPTNVSHLWIVDNGTDRVYQYDNAAGRTSGSQSASTSFALAAGNTNPQGIADPPAVAAARSGRVRPRRTVEAVMLGNDQESKASIDALFSHGSPHRRKTRTIFT
jgi:Calx-beta domain-containing protein